MNYFYVFTGLLHLIIGIQQIISASVRPGTTSAYHPTGNITIDRPPDSEKDDLLLLFLSRTDDALPMQLYGWVPVASCLKKHNNVKSCMTIEECDLVWKTYYCYGGHDLGKKYNSFHRQLECNFNHCLYYRFNFTFRDRSLL